jgi:hypothetical protein
MSGRMVRTKNSRLRGIPDTFAVSDKRSKSGVTRDRLVTLSSAHVERIQWRDECRGDFRPAGEEQATKPHVPVGHGTALRKIN